MCNVQNQKIVLVPHERYLMCAALKRPQLCHAHLQFHSHCVEKLRKWIFYFCLYFTFPLIVQKHAGRRITYSKLLIGMSEHVNVCVCVCWCPAIDWHPVWREFSHLAPSVPGIISDSTTTLIM